jgi:hypothetical protein
MENCTMLVYTHSEYSDIFDVAMRRFKKYASSLPITICTDKSGLILGEYGEGYNIGDVFEYDNALVYHLRLASILERIGTKYVCLNHDNNVLFDHLDISGINTYIGMMDVGNIQVLRLSPSLICEPKSGKGLIEPITEPSWYCSVLPTIWERESLLSLCKKFQKSYIDSESPECNTYVAGLNCYYIAPSEKDDFFPHYYHSTSHVYPCVHAIKFGKWYMSLLNIKEMPQCERRVFEILLEYDIDIGIRGTQEGIRAWSLITSP